MLFPLICSAGYGQAVNDWENPQIVGINKEPYHATRTLDKYTIDANNPYSYGFIISCN